MISNQEFIIKEIPQYHPASQKYLSFWRNEKKSCIEGKWVSGKYMPGKLYTYINYGTIKRNIGNSKVKSYARPLLRDIEWEIFTLLTEARGFSGFALDDEFTSLEVVKEWLDLGEDTPSSWFVEEYPLAVNPHTGKFKKYISPREALNKLYPDNMGRAIFDNNSHNYFICGPRGFGKSFSMGAIVGTEYLFDGMTEYTLGYSTTSEVVVGAGEAKYSSETLDKVKTMIERLPGAQEINGVFYPSPFYKRYAGSWAPGSQITATYKKKVGNNWENAGSKSNIKHRTFKDNPFAANGTRPGLMLFEEVGMFSNLIDSYMASVECQREGSRKFGTMLFIGTGGDMSGGGTLDAQKMFYEPENFDCISFVDEWEHRGRIGYFIPAYKGLHDFKDSEGNTKVEEAKTYLEKLREKLRLTKGSSAALEGEIVNRPLVPSEMFLQRAGAIFPVPELRELFSRLENSRAWDLVEMPVSLYFDPNSIYNGVNYKIDLKKEFQPINNFPWKGTSREGCPVIYELPQLIDGKVPKGAYLIGHDPYGSDSVDGESLGAIIVMKSKKYFTELGHDEVVAVYYGRPWQGRHIVNETLYKLSKFYGDATIYFENVRGNVKEYFEKIKRLDLLAHKPQTVLVKKASHVQAPTLEYGYPMSNRDMKMECAIYVRDWLLEERSTEDGKVIRNLDKLWDKFLIQQLIAFNLDGNFDAVMAFMGCVIGLNETYNQYENTITRNTKSSVDTEIEKFLGNNKTVFRQTAQITLYNTQFKL